MAKPTFYADGNTPRRMDGKITVWKKLLGALQGNAGKNSGSDPVRMETLQQTKRKALASTQKL